MNKHKSLPSECSERKPPVSAPLSASSLTKEQFNLEMQKGMDDFEKGRVVSIDAVEEEIMQVLYLFSRDKEEFNAVRNTP